MGVLPCTLGRDCILYEFPKAAVTSYYQLGDLKQQQSILSEFWRLVVQIQDVSQVPEAQRENLAHDSLPASGGCLESLAFLGLWQLQSLP